MTALSYILVLLNLIVTASSGFSENKKPVNKLQQMFHLYYLPFSIEFREGKTIEEIFPFAPDKFREFTRLIRPDDLQKVDSDWDKIRSEWKKKSLILTSNIKSNQSLRISPRLVSHQIPLSRNVWQGLTLEERMQFEASIKGKSEKTKKYVTHLRILRSFLKPTDNEKFNFFVIGPDWCESSREYKAILEAYFKRFEEREWVLHAVTIEDPKEEIFDSKIMNDLFPNPEKYTHDIVPKFIAIQMVNGETKVWEEGEALKELYDRYFKSRRGFLDKQIAIGKNLFPPPLTPESPVSFLSK